MTKLSSSSIKSRLQVHYKTKRWAWEELVFDTYLMYENKLYSRGLVYVLYHFLAPRYGSLWGAVKHARTLLREAGNVPVPVLSDCNIHTVRKEAARILREDSWVIQEMLEWDIRGRALRSSKRLGTMYRVLRRKYGSAREILETLDWLTSVQRGRGKTYKWTVR